MSHLSVVQTQPLILSSFPQILEIVSNSCISSAKVSVNMKVNLYLLAYCKLLGDKSPRQSLISEIQRQTEKVGEVEENGGTTERRSLKETLILLASQKYSQTAFNEMRIILKSVGFTGAKNSRTLVVDTSLPPSSKLFWHLAALIHVNIQLRQLMRWWCSDTTTDWNEVVSFGFSSLVRVSLVRSFFPSCLLIFPFVTFSCTSFVCLSSPPYCRVASPQSFNFSPPDHPLLSASLTSL